MVICINNIKTSALASIGLSQTSKGVLLKWNTKNYYYKSGSLHYGVFNKTQPVVESICSKIRTLLGFTGVDYHLEIVKSDGTDQFEPQEILCCVSRNFLKCDETLITFAKHYKSFKGTLTYDKLINDFKEFEEEINQTLIFDFIVNNIDRHYNNFGYIINGSRKYCPIFDNGLSLYSGLTSDDLININKKPYLNKRFDKSKPFAQKHISQIKLINNLPKINLCATNEEFINIIKEYEGYLGKDRYIAMCNLLKERLDHVRKLYSNV